MIISKLMVLLKSEVNFEFKNEIKINIEINVKISLILNFKAFKIQIKS